MSGTEIIAGIGIGIIVSKLLDIFWLEKIKEEREIKNWLRKERLKAYSALSKTIMSFSMHEAKKHSVFEDLALFSDAALLTVDEALVKELKDYIDKVGEVHRLLDTGDEKDAEKANSLFHSIFDNRLELVAKLRNELRQYKSE